MKYPFIRDRGGMGKSRKNLELLHPTPIAENCKRLIKSELQVFNGQSFVITSAASQHSTESFVKIYCYHLINKLKSHLKYFNKK